MHDTTRPLWFCSRACAGRSYQRYRCVFWARSDYEPSKWPNASLLLHNSSKHSVLVAYDLGSSIKGEVKIGILSTYYLWVTITRDISRLNMLSLFFLEIRPLTSVRTTNFSAPIHLTSRFLHPLVSEVNSSMHIRFPWSNHSIVLFWLSGSRLNVSRDDRLKLLQLSIALDQVLKELNDLVHDMSNVTRVAHNVAKVGD